jgi:hypothetical protein
MARAEKKPKTTERTPKAKVEADLANNQAWREKGPTRTKKPDKVKTVIPRRTSQR